MLNPGSLEQLLADRSARAVEVGAQLPLPTRVQRLRDGPVWFLMQMASRTRNPSTARPSQTASAATRSDPFLPYEPDLFVTDLTDTHVVLLNKYNVLARHALIVTRAFAPQDCLLSVADFVAAAHALRELSALVFYNSGSRAGASQPHRHLQLVPLPLAPGFELLPAQCGAGTRPPGCRDALAGLGFPHACAGRSWSLDEPRAAGRNLHELYVDLITTLGVDAATDTPLSPYNLLLTRDWMFIVRRSQEHHGAISLNALAFAGALLVRDQAERALLERRTPRSVLADVVFPGATVPEPPPD